MHLYCRLLHTEEIDVFKTFFPVHCIKSYFLCVSASDWSSPEYPKQISKFEFAGQDQRNYSIIDRHLSDVIQFVENALDSKNPQHSKSKILIHCYAGVNRSATILICLLIKIWKFSLLDAVNGTNFCCFCVTCF